MPQSLMHVRLLPGSFFFRRAGELLFLLLIFSKHQIKYAEDVHMTPASPHR